MPLVLELPEDIELRLREAAQSAGRDISAYIIEAASEQARREKAGHAARLDALQEITRINEELGLYDWELDANSNRAT